jgi:hypothetical protein
MDSSDMAAYMRQRREGRRARLREMLGDACVQCGATEALDFDHIERSTKSFEISGRALDGPWARLLDEVAKCQLLCRPCHILKTSEEAAALPRVDYHGTEYGYVDHKCRCDLCYEARRQARIRRGDQQGLRKRGQYRSGVA